MTQEKDLFAPYRRDPRPGFPDRVMARIGSLGKEPSRRPFSRWGIFGELVGAAAALWLFAAALSVPDPAWSMQDQVLSQTAQTAWASGERIAVPDWMEE